MPEEKTKSSAASKDLMGTLEYYFVDKAPFQLPAGVKEWIVQYGPWITLVLLLLALPGLLLILGLSAVVAPAAVATGQGATLGVNAIFLIGTLVLQAVAIPALIKRKIGGWNLVFYASVLSLVSSILSVNIISGLIGALISFYILFQIRSYYK